MAYVTEKAKCKKSSDSIVIENPYFILGYTPLVIFSRSAKSMTAPIT